MMYRLRRLYRALTPLRQRDLLATLLLMLAAAVAEIVTIASVMPFVALLAEPDFATKIGTGNLPPVWIRGPIVTAALTLIGAGLVASALRLAMLWMTQRTVHGVGHELSIMIYESLLRQSYAAHLHRNSSEALSGLEKVQTVINAVLHPVMQGAIAAALALAIATLLFIIDPLATAAMILILSVGYAGLAVATGRDLQLHSRTLATSITKRTKLVRESFGNIRDILLDASHSLFEQRFSESDLEMRRGRVISGFVASAPRPIVEAAAILGLASIAVLVAWRSHGLMAALPVLGSLALGSQRLLPLVQQVWFGYAQARSNTQLVDDVLDLATAPRTSLKHNLSCMPINGDIVFEDVSFSYNSTQEVMNGISIQISKGETIGISGPTGSGKSTFLDLLMGLLEPRTGTITIGGRALSAHNQQHWQASLSHVPQSLYLIDDTILANITLGEAVGEIDRERAWHAARLAQADSFISSLPSGMETAIGERGIRLSGGERQRLGIARALYRDRPVLILDEATSALDPGTESAVLQGLTDRDITVIIVTHRENTLRFCDRVFVLERGLASNEQQRLRAGC